MSRNKEFFAQLDWLMPSLSGAELLRRQGDLPEAEKKALKVIRDRLKNTLVELPRLDLCGDIQSQADKLLERKLELLNGEVTLQNPVDWFALSKEDNQRNWHLGYMYWLNCLAEAYKETDEEKYALQWRVYVEEFLEHCPYASDARGYWPTSPMVHNDLQTCNLGENGGPNNKHANPEARTQWMSLSCHFRIETWLSNLSRLVKSDHLDDDFLIRVLTSLLNEHAYVCIMNPRENTPNQFTAVSLSLLKLSLLIPEYRPSASYFLVAWERFKRVISNNMFEDGSDTEQSPDYNTFLLDLCVEVLDLLKDAPDSRKAIVEEAAKKRLHFLVSLLTPEGSLPPFGKCHFEERKTHLINLAKKLNDKECLKKLSPTSSKSSESNSFPYGGYYCIRNSPLELIFKASAIGSGHMHEDCLSFLLWHKGDLLLTDPSHFTYNDNTTEEKKLNTWALSTASHNSICFNGKSQNRMAVRKNWPRKDEEVPYLRASEQNALPFRFFQSHDFDFVEGQYSDGYGPKAGLNMSHTRSIIRVQNLGFLVIDDLFGNKEENNAQQHWHMAESFKESEITILNDNELITTRHAASNLRILRLDSNPTTPELFYGSMEPTAGWTFPKYGRKSAAPELIWHSPFSNHTSLITWIEPADKVATNPTTTLNSTKDLYQWSTLNDTSLTLQVQEKEIKLSVSNSKHLVWERKIGGALHAS